MWPKVLIADDDSKNRQFISDVLINCGCEVAAAQDGKEALEKAMELKPDLILMDIQMPVMNGFDSLARIRHAQGTGGIKIVAMASPDVKEEIQEIEKADFDGYLSKPADTRKLQELIAGFHNKSKKRRNAPKILCVDDEPLNLRLLEAILEPAGYDLSCVSDGYGALAFMKRAEIDLVLLDVMMPGINGYEVCRLIKASAQTARVPVIMITALSSKEDRIQSIEAGAEDFITKPFEKTEVLTRINKLLEIRERDSKINSLYGMLAGLAERGNRSAELRTYKKFNFMVEVDALIRGTTPGRGHGPRGMLLGSAETGWIKYDMSDPDAYRRGKPISNENLSFLLDGQARIFYANDGESSSAEALVTAQALIKDGIKPGNFICRAGAGLCLVAYDSRKTVSEQDSVVLKAIAMQIMFLRSISSEISETEKAFEYMVLTLARAAEANDEDTGMHILRVGEYAGLMAEKMGLNHGFPEMIKMQAQLHDAGKIHIPQEILKKHGVLTAAEFEVMKLHTVYGAKIIGVHERFSMANKIANYHHEKWDGSGYPLGLKGTAIPLEARITAIADQYDALRNERVYKPAFSHEKAYEIIVKGDGRTKPGHFDPEVLSAFIKHASAFEEIYEKIYVTKGFERGNKNTVS